MSATDQTGVLELPCYVAGEEVGSEPLEVIYPYSGELAGRVRMVDGSGLGIKEGVIEAIKCMTNVKTFSLPW